MTCRLALCMLIGLASLSCGCRMCSSAYDYCGPVFDDGGHNFFYRKNSILGGDADGGYAAEYLESEAAEEPLQPIPAPSGPQARHGQPTPAR